MDEMRKKTKWQALIIVMVCVSVLVANQAMIRSVWQDRSLSRGQATIQIIQRLLGMPKPRQEMPSVASTEGNQVTNTEPHELTAIQMQSPTYQAATQVAQVFNQTLDLAAVNQHFTQLVNQQRLGQGWSELTVATHLAEGTFYRAQELSDYHYLSSLTHEGENFTVVYPAIWNSDSRLGESTFELHIATNDIHVQTWQEHPDVLAAYLQKSFSQILQSDLSASYQSQYVAVYASASEQNFGEVPYVRLLAVLTSDTLAE